jgi:hypothetical protein
MNEIDHFKFFILCSGDMAADVDHLHVKIIHLVHLVSFSYIVIEDYLCSYLEVSSSSHCSLWDLMEYMFIPWGGEWVKQVAYEFLCRDPASSILMQRNDGYVWWKSPIIGR